jgi:hypothetical protein
MPMILAMNGALFGELGAVSQSVADLQTALVALGKGIGDAILKKIVIDGLMGPKTAAATNRAMTVHLGAGQAPANLRTGNLSQQTISAQAATLAQLIETEIARRGFAAPVSKRVVAKTTRPATPSAPPMVYTPPAPAAPIAPAVVAPIYQVPRPPAGADLGSVMKWAAIGVGVVAVGGLAYYLSMRRRQSAMAGFGTTDPIDDHERELWVNNDEGLYRWYQQESRRMKGGMRAFIKRNRAEIDAAIRGVRDRDPAKTRFHMGLGNVARADEDALEAIIDRAPSLRDVFASISSIADGKAEHLETNWQDTAAAREWNRFARAVDRFGAKVVRICFSRKIKTRARRY